MWFSVTFVVCLANVLVLGEDAGKRNFWGYTVFRVIPTDERQIQFLRSLELNHDNGVDFWSHTGTVNRPVDIMVSPEQKESFVQLMDKEGVSKVVLTSNLEKQMAEERGDDVLMDRAPAGFFSKFQRLADIHNYLDELASKHSNIASVQNIGKSTEGRNLKVLKISTGGSNKPIFWLDGGIHAREWISQATVTYIASQLVEESSSNSEIRQLIEDYDWYILPVVNPDGYEYTHTRDRMWRKTRSRSTNGCYGVDPNRNFGYKWLTGGSSTQPCSDTYAGKSAFSEPETKALADYVLSLGSRVKSFVTVHAYSQMWLFPWGWTSALPKDYDQMKAAADTAVSALTKVYGTRYTIGTSTNVLYVASGGSDDWAYGAAGIKYSYTVELRDTGRYGFILPPNQIIPTGEETFQGVKALANFITNNP